MFEKGLKYFRLKNSMTKKDLAKHCGLTPMASSNYENGSRKPSMEIINKNMSPEQHRSAISCELVHIFFQKPAEITGKKEGQLATAISGAFLFPCADAIRELGIRRKCISKDMDLVCQEYGISMYMLVKRAQTVKIVSEEAAKKFYIMANKQGWRTHEPVRIPPATPLLFKQLVFRAVCENEISIQKGAELMQMPYDEVRSHCLFSKVEENR